jgi:hypothetical protein
MEVADASHGSSEHCAGGNSPAIISQGSSSERWSGFHEERKPGKLLKPSPDFYNKTSVLDISAIPESFWISQSRKDVVLRD